MSNRLSRAPAPPKHLNPRAAEEWRRLAPACIALGTLTAVDLRAFELLTVTLAAESEARELLAATGLTVSTGQGGCKPHPAVRMAETARRQAAQLLADFGLTPRGRKGVSTRWDWDTDDDD